MSFIFDSLFKTKNKSVQPKIKQGAARLPGFSYNRLVFEPLEERTLLAVWLPDQILDTAGVSVGDTSDIYADKGELRAVLAPVAKCETIKYDPNISASDPFSSANAQSINTATVMCSLTGTDGGGNTTEEIEKQTLDVPTDISVVMSDPQTKTVIVSWSAVTNATGYKYRCKDLTVNYDWGEWPEAQLETTFTVSDVVPGHCYEFQIVAVGDSDYSDSDESLGQRNFVLMTSPTDFSATNPGENRLNFSWSEVTFNIDDLTPSVDVNASGYSGSWQKDSDDPVLFSITDGKNVELQLDNVDEGVPYTINIRTLAPTNKDRFIDFILDSCSSSYTVTKLTTPANFKVSNATTDSVTLAWDGPADHEVIGKYQLMYKAKNDTEWTELEVESDQLSYTVSGLTSVSEYSFKIRAINAAGDSTYTNSDESDIIQKELSSLVVTTAEDVFNPYDGVISLREAILYAGSDGLGNGITFSNSIDWNTTPIDLKLGELWINKDLTINGNVSTGTKVTINADGANRIFNINNDSYIICNVSLSGMKLYGGTDDSVSDPTEQGGAIFLREDLSLQDITINDFNALNGGAIYSEGSLSLLDSSFSGNSAENGGAIAIKAPMNEFIVLKIRNSYFIGNQATGKGGAIYTNTETNSQLDVAIMNTVIHSNSASDGGGICNWGGDNMKMTVVDSTISLNTITDSSKAGSQLYNNEGKLYLINDLVVNRTIMTSPVILNNGSDNLYLYNVLADNTAEDVFVSTDSTQTDLAINPTGPAATGGTFVGNILSTAPNVGNGEFYYLLGNTWYKAGEDSTTFLFDSTNADGNYGLGSNDITSIKEVYTTALNVDTNGNHVARNVSTEFFNAGAYAINYKYLTKPEMTLLEKDEKSITISWGVGDTEPASYHLSLYDDALMTNLVYDQSELTKDDADAFLVDHLLTGVSLNPNTSYYLKIDAVPENGKPWLHTAATAAFTTKGIVATPTITAEKSGTEEIHFSWDTTDVKNISRWNVKVTQGTNVVYNQDETDFARAANYSVSGLKMGEFYQVTVTAIVANDAINDMVNASDSIQFVTEVSNQMPPNIYDITTLCSTTNNTGKMNISWMPVEKISTYTVNVYEVMGKNLMMVYSDRNVTDPSLTISKSNNTAYKYGEAFTQGTEYYIEVISNGIENPVAGTAKVLIGDLKAKITSAWNVGEERPELTVSWKKVDHAESYDVAIYADENGTQLVLSGSVVDKTSLTFDVLRNGNLHDEPLVQGVEYWARVQANLNQDSIKRILINDSLIATKTVVAPQMIDVALTSYTNYKLDVNEAGDTFSLSGNNDYLLESGEVGEGGIMLLGDEDRVESFTITEAALSNFNRIYIKGNNGDSSICRDIINLENVPHGTAVFDSLQSMIQFDDVPDSAYGTGSVSFLNDKGVAWSGARNLYVKSHSDDTFRVNELNSNINLICDSGLNKTLDFSGLDTSKAPGVVMNMDSTWHQAAVLGQLGTLSTNVAIPNIILSSGTDTIIGSENGTELIDTSKSSNVILLKGGTNRVDFNGMSTINAMEETLKNDINIGNADYSIINLSKVTGENTVTLNGNNVVLIGSKGEDTVMVTGDCALLSMSKSEKSTIKIIGNNASITTGDGDDTITLIGSNSYVSTSAGNDRIYLEDALSVSTGNNIINGGAGDDLIIALNSSGNNIFTPEWEMISFSVALDPKRSMDKQAIISSSAQPDRIEYMAEPAVMSSVPTEPLVLIRSFPIPEKQLPRFTMMSICFTKN